MKSIVSVLSAFVVILIAAASMATESLGVVKGNFRDLYPDAIIKTHDSTNIAKFIGFSVSSAYVDNFQAEYKRGVTLFLAHAAKYCENRSDYYIVDNFEINTSFNSAGMLMTTTANIICFDLPSPTKKK